MAPTTDVVHSGTSLRGDYRRCGYYFREAAMLTIAGYWFSYLLLIVVYPLFLTMLWKLEFKE